MILIIASTVFRLIGPNKLSEITDIVSKSIPIFDFSTNSIVLPGTPFDVNEIWKIVIFLASIYILGAIFNYIANVLIARASFKTSQKLRQDISQKIQLSW